MQILNDLRRSGLIDSRRGKTGGYLLARNAAQITLRQVVEAVDPALLQCSVARDGESGPAVRSAWEKISAGLFESLDQITLESLASNPGGDMFYI